MKGALGFWVEGLVTTYGSGIPGRAWALGGVLLSALLGSCDETVLRVVEVAVVEVLPSSTNLEVWDTVQLSVTLKGPDGRVLSGRSITWSSGSQSVATVTPQGLVTAVGAGSALIRAVSEGVEGQVAVSVTNPGPTLESVSPDSTRAGWAGFEMTVTGHDFVSTSVVRWGGFLRATTFVNPTELRAIIVADDLVDEGSSSIS
jgi:hypothetical protein